MLAGVALLAALVGPVQHTCPAGVVVARDAETFRRELASEKSEIWLAGRVRGDFEAKRGLAIHGCEAAVLEGSGAGTILKLAGDDILVEDVAFEHSGARVSSEDGALKISGERAIVRRVAVRDSLYGIALEQCHQCRL